MSGLCQARGRAAAVVVTAVLVTSGAAAVAHAHGTMEYSRIYRVKMAGPAGGTPAAWNESYYTWNQNSNNFTTYASPAFEYADAVPDGKISNAGVNDGVQTALNFSGLNTPSAAWPTTPATAGQSLPVRWLATAPHDPSYFEVYLTRQGFDITSQSLGWGSLENLGRWKIGDALRPVTTGTAPNPLSGDTASTYEWSIPIPADRAGRHAMVVVWQREDPAGEAFFSTNDLAITVPEPASAGVVGGAAVVGLLARRRRRARALRNG